MGEIEILSSLLDGEPLPLKILPHPLGTLPIQDPLYVPLLQLSSLQERGTLDLVLPPLGLFLTKELLPSSLSPVSLGKVAREMGVTKSAISKLRQRGVTLGLRKGSN